MNATQGTGEGAVGQVLAALAKSGVIPRIAPALGNAMAGAGAALRETVLAEIPAFSASGNPEILPELDRHARDHLSEIKRLFSGGPIGSFDFVRTHAHHRAEQRFPLEATLHAYRCGHKVLSRWLREAAIATAAKPLEAAVSAIADFSIEYTNAISAIATAEYVAHTRRLAEAEGDLRTELLNILLSGYDESDGRVARLLKRAGYLEQRQSYCVVAVQSVNAAEMENPARAQRIVAALSDAFVATAIRPLAGVRNNLVIAVLAAARRQSGWTRPQVDLADRATKSLLGLGPAVLVGLSADHPSTSFVPKALQEATIALDFADVSRRVLRFADLPLRRLLLHRVSDAVRAAPPHWIATLIEADAKSKGALIQTLRAVADADMNLQRAARDLGRHPNTVYARLLRVKELTGLDAQRYHDLTEMLLAADCWGN
jgi:hypothetical protein